MSNVYRLKGLKPRNIGYTNFYECCDLTKKVPISSIIYIIMFLKMYISEEKNYATLHKNRKTSFVITVGPPLSGFYIQKKVLEKKSHKDFFRKIGLCIFFINHGITMIIKIDIWGLKNNGPPVELGYLDFRRVWKLNIKYKCWAIEIERQPFLHQNTKAIFLLIRIVCVFDFIFSFSAIILEKGQLLYLTITNDVKMFFCFVYQMWDVCILSYVFFSFILGKFQ